MANNPRSFLLALCLFIVLFGGAVYNVDAAIFKSTNESDVQGWKVLLTRFPYLVEAAIDPCYPVKVTWVTCNNDDSPRVTELDLGSKNLIGALPDFSSMDALEKINLQNNGLTGSIPEFLGKLPKLEELNLSNNFFTGSIPSSLKSNTKLKTNLSGNIGLGQGFGNSRSTEKTSKNLPLILGICLFAIGVHGNWV